MCACASDMGAHRQRFTPRALPFFFETEKLRPSHRDKEKSTAKGRGGVTAVRVRRPAREDGACLVQPENQKFSRFFVTSNLVAHA